MFPVSINNLDMKKWKQYDDIITDSLWLFPSRDNNGVHDPGFHGNFIPQIPRQAIMRFTKRGEWVLDPFMGAGTTLIEAKYQGRNAIGIDINNEILEVAKEKLKKIESDTVSEVFNADSTDPSTYKELKKINGKFQLLMIHPPYWDIIHFTTKVMDLSNSATLTEFLDKIDMVIKNTYDLLDPERYMVFVIGDKYENGALVPLSYYTLQVILKYNYILKGIVVKNIEENKAKRGKYSLWRYRALKSGYFVFKHEYIYFLKKGD
ncbi:MAG: TRM11 family SAM-dependent methyltransferase [Thermoplasmata archaeon]